MASENTQDSKLKKTISNWPPYLIPISSIVALLVMGLMAKTIYSEVRNSPKTNVELIKQTEPIGKDSLILNYGKIDTIYYQYEPTLKSTEDDPITPLKDLNRKAVMNLSPAILIYVFFVSAVSGVGTGLSLFLIWLIYDTVRKAETKVDWTYWALGLVSVLAAGMGLKLINAERSTIMSGVEIMKSFEIVFNDPGRATSMVVNSFSLIGLVPIFAIATSFYVIWYVFRSGNCQVNDKKDAYKKIKSYLNVNTLIAALMVSSTVISTGMQRNMIVDQLLNADALYPDTIIYVYGAAFTVLLGVFVFPAYFYLEYAAEQDIQDLIEERKPSDHWWDIGKQTIDNIKVAIGVVLPLLTSIIQPLLSGA